MLERISVAKERLRCAVADADIGETEWVDTFDARDIEAKYLGVAAPLVVRVDATDFAKIMLCRHCVPLVQGEHVEALGNPETGQRNIGHDCSLSSTEGAIAPAWIFKAVFEIDFESDRTTMTATVFGFHDDGDNLMGRVSCALTRSREPNADGIQSNNPDSDARFGHNSAYRFKIQAKFMGT